MAERIHKRGKAFIRFECECGQKQETLETENVPQVCARCGKGHSVHA